MDSLMTVELVHRLERTLGLKLPANLAIDHPNLEALACYLSTRLVVEPAPAARSAAAGLDALATPELASLLARELEAD
jgi:hypothetical protein